MLAIAEFLKNIPTRLVDKCVEQIIENDLVYYHVKYPLNNKKKTIFGEKDS